jgi:uncharacterized protein YjgD (DUF1641 family)
MTELQIQEQLDAIHGKLDTVIAEISLQQRHRREMDDLKDDLLRVGKDMYKTVLVDMDELDRKGYFAFIRELSAVLNRVVTSFSAEDVKKLGDNIVTILTTVKNLTQPEIMHTINNAMTVYRSVDVRVPENVSLLSLLKELNTPEAKRGMTYAIRFLKAVAASAGMKTPNGQGEHHGN